MLSQKRSKLPGIIVCASAGLLSLSAQTKPVISKGGVISIAGPVASQGLTPGGWVSIYGSNLSASTREWRSSDFSGNNLPTHLDDVSVTIDGRAAFLSYISPGLINLQVPDDPNVGLVSVTVANNNGASAPEMVNMQPYAPRFKTFDQYVAAQHSDGSLVSPVGKYLGSTPAKPGETIAIYAVGFGPSNPLRPAGQIITSAPLDLSKLRVLIGGAQAAIGYAGLIGPGLYQFNVTVPDSASDGDQQVVATIAGFQTQPGVFVAIKNPNGSAPAPAITFTADQMSIQSGQSTFLRWTVSNATTVSLDQGIGTVALTSSRQIAPTSTTTYTLTASGTGGSRSASITVSVAQQSACTTPLNGGAPAWNTDIVQFTGDLQKGASHWQGFTLNAQTALAFKSVSDYVNQAAIVTEGELTNFKNGAAFSGFAIFDGTSGLHPVTLPAGNYYAAVRYFGNGTTHVRFELDALLQVPGASFVDYYLNQAIPVAPNGGLAWQPFTIQCGFRYLLDGLNSGVEMYVIDASQFDNFKSNRTFQFYRDYSGGSGVIDEDQPDDYELKLPPGDYYLAYRNPAGNTKQAVYVMSRWR